MEFDKPSPQQRTGHDYSKNPLKGAPQIEYKTGKLEAVASKMFFDGRLTEGDQAQKFSYYDSEEKMRRTLDKFTAYVLGVYSGCFSHGSERGDIRYFSNLVPDSRTGIINVQFWNGDRTQTLVCGNYQNDISPVFKGMGRKSAFTKVIVAYVAEMKQVVEFHLNATLEAGFLKAIAAAHGVPEHKASLFDLATLSTEVWVFQFGGAFEPVVFSPKDARNTPPTVPATANDKVIYFQPVLVGGVIKQENPKYSERVASIMAMYTELSEYIASEQAHLRGLVSGAKKNIEEGSEAAFESAPKEQGRGGFTDAVQASRNYAAFPTEEPPVGALEGDPLPF